MRFGPLSLALLPFLLLGAVGSANAQMPYEQKLDEVKQFKKFYKKYKDEATRVESIMDLKVADCPDAVQALLPILKGKDPVLKEAAKEVIASFREPGTFSFIIETLEKMRDRTMRAGFFDILSQAKQNKLKPVIRTLWTEERKKLSILERYYIAKSLERLGAHQFEDVLGALAFDKAWEVQVAALDSIKKNKIKELGPKIVPLLGAKIPQVKTATIQTVAILRPSEAVWPLIEILKEPGRSQIDASEALFAITMRDYGTDYKRWKKQWTFLTSLEGFRLPTEAEIAKTRETREKYNVIYGKLKGKKSTFAGIPTTSTRIVYIIDVSASMNDVIVDKAKFRDGGYKSFQKLEIVKTELIRTINGLDKTVHFNIIAFAAKTKSWKKWLTPCSINQKASAISFVKRLQPLGLGGGAFGGGADGSGKTNTYAALTKAFDYDPNKGVVLTGNQKSRRVQLDTIYFLSDGVPTIGKFTDTDDILREVRKVNEVRKVVIHCISIGDFQAGFLKTLAQQNGGVFVDLGG